MLKLNPKRMMLQRGIDKMYAFLYDRGFTRSSAEKLAKGAVANLKVKHLGRLCFLLNCTPNDLFEWENTGAEKLPAHHALNALVKENFVPKSLNEMLRDIPPEKLPEVENLLKNLKDG